MKKILHLLSLFVTRVTPLIIIGVNHVYEEDGGLNLTLIGSILVFIVIFFLWYKPLSKEVEVWKIQNVNKMFVINFSYIKVLLFLGFAWFLFQSIGDNVALLQNTIFQIALAYVIGWLLRVFSI